MALRACAQVLHIPIATAMVISIAIISLFVSASSFLKCINIYKIRKFEPQRHQRPRHVDDLVARGIAGSSRWRHSAHSTSM